LKPVDRGEGMGTSPDFHPCIQAGNDTYGQDAGDKAIDAIARTIRDVYGDNLSYRANPSGDEFLGLHPHPAQAEALAKEGQRGLGETRMEVDGPEGKTYIDGIGVRYGTGKTRAEADLSANAVRNRPRQPGGTTPEEAHRNPPWSPYHPLPGENLQQYLRRVPGPVKILWIKVPE